ncbi:MAG: hypothetical protein RIS80_992 [Actinomycetota bacterium]
MLVSTLLALVLSIGSTLTSTSAANAVDGLSGKSYVEGNDAAAAIFDPLVVNRADITLPTQSYNNLQANGKGDYQPASFVFTTKDGASQQFDVGVRLKGGWGSLRNLDGKAGFKVKMNFSVKGQKLFGIKKFTFNNMVQDPSMVHEAVVYRLFRGMGVPAPRIGYVRVYVNGVDYGLHLNVETYDSVMLNRWFSSTQHLYEGAYWQDIVDGQYQAMQIDEGDLTKRDDLAALALVNNTKDGKEWFDSVQKYLDLDEFVKEMAVERYIGHWDGYAWTIKNNYYAHSTAEGVFTILPWGTDQTLNGWVDIFGAGDVGIMANKCMNYSPCQQLYKGALLRVNDTAKNLDLPTMLDDVWKSISEDVRTDPRKEAGYDYAAQVKDGSRNHLTWVYSWLTDAVNSNNLPNSPRVDKSSNISLSYPVPEEITAGLVLNPTVTRDGGASPVVYQVVNGLENCSVGFSTGVLTIKNVGYCRIAARTTAWGTWAASLDYYEILNTRITGDVTITPIDSIKFGETKTVAYQTRSKGAASLTAIGDCEVVSGFTISATSGSGDCTVTVDVEADGTFEATSSSISFVTERGNGVAKPLTKDANYIGSLPNGGSIELSQTPSLLIGNCKRVGRILYAKASSGSCLVTFSASQDANWNYPAKSHTVKLISGVQTFVGHLTTTGTYNIGFNRWLIAKQVKPVTSMGVSTTWVTYGRCTISEVAGKTYVTLKTKTGCTVALKSNSYLGLPSLTNTWVLKY